MIKQALGADVKIGDIYLVNFDGNGNVQRGLRPAVVFQNNKGNVHSPNVIVLPLTSRIKKIFQPTHVVLHAEVSGLKCDSVVLCENPVCVPKSALGQYITALSEDYIREIARANILAFGGIGFLNQDELLGLRNKAVELNGVA